MRKSAKQTRIKVGDKVKVKLHTKGPYRFSKPLTVLQQVNPSTFLLSDGKKWNASKLTLVPHVAAASLPLMPRSEPITDADFLACYDDSGNFPSTSNTELLPRQSIPSAPAVQCDDAPAEVHTPMPATQDQPSGLQEESPGCSSSPTVNAPNSNTGEGRDGNGSSKSAQDSHNPQSFLPGSDGNGSSESAHGSRNPQSSGRDGDRSSKSAPDSRNTQSLPAGPGSRHPQRTRKPPAHLKDYITD